MTGSELNEVNTFAEVRKLLASEYVVDIFRGDVDTITQDGTVWVESATSTNLPTGATQGFLRTRSTIINGDRAFVQTFDGTDGSNGLSSTRYKCATCNTYYDWA
jgi:hypothetical protein